MNSVILRLNLSTAATRLRLLPPAARGVEPRAGARPPVLAARAAEPPAAGASGVTSELPAASAAAAGAAGVRAMVAGAAGVSAGPGAAGAGCGVATGAEGAAVVAWAAAAAAEAAGTPSLVRPTIGVTGGSNSGTASAAGASGAAPGAVRPARLLAACAAAAAGAAGAGSSGARSLRCSAHTRTVLSSPQEASWQKSCGDQATRLAAEVWPRSLTGACCGWSTCVGAGRREGGSVALGRCRVQGRAGRRPCCCRAGPAAAGPGASRARSTSSGRQPTGATYAPHVHVAVRRAAGNQAAVGAEAGVQVVGGAAVARQHGGGLRAQRRCVVQVVGVVGA